MKIMNITSFSRIRTKDHTLDFHLVVIAKQAADNAGDVRGFAARIGIDQTRPQRIDIQRTDA